MHKHLLLSNASKTLAKDCDWHENRILNTSMLNASSFWELIDMTSIRLRLGWSDFLTSNENSFAIPITIRVILVMLLTAWAVIYVFLIFPRKIWSFGRRRVLYRFAVWEIAQNGLSLLCSERLWLRQIFQLPLSWEYICIYLISGLVMNLTNERDLFL